MTEENKLESVEIDIKGKIELEKFPIEQYLGKKVKIAQYETFKNPKFNSYVLKVFTEKLGEWVNNENETKEITASRMFGLQVDKSGNIGFGDDTKLGLFMKKMNVEHIKDLVGLEVITQSVTRTEGDFLTFN